MSKELEYLIAMCLTLAGGYMYWQSWGGTKRPNSTKLDWEVRDLSDRDKSIYKALSDQYQIGKNAVWFLSMILFLSTLYFFTTTEEADIDAMTDLPPIPSQCIT